MSERTMDERLYDGAMAIYEVLAELVRLRDENARLREENLTLTADLAIVRHARALSLLGRSSEQEAREDRLRTQLAEAQVSLDEIQTAAFDGMAFDYGRLCTIRRVLEERGTR